jgi:hypothetical protein
MYTVVYNSSTLKVIDVIEGKTTFTGLVDGLQYGAVDAAPAVGDILATEPSDGATRTKAKANLATLVAALNAAYSGLALSASDTYAEAAAKLFAVSASYEHCTQLKLIYDTLKETA